MVRCAPNDVHNPLADSALGKPAEQSVAYDPALLFAVPRAPARAALGIEPGAALPFEGEDLWTAYEVSWLDGRGKPRVAIGHLRVPADSPQLVESKSLKLYLNAFHGERMESAEALRARVVADLTRITGAGVGLVLMDPANSAVESAFMASGEPVSLLDGMDIACGAHASPEPAFLDAAGNDIVEESLCTHAFRSNCPVTGQPDFASVWVRYRGPRIDRAGLLRYLVSYRAHAALHEQCAERIFLDIDRRCTPEALAVAARFTRRGGLDINPQRASPGYVVAWPGRTLRQ